MNLCINEGCPDPGSTNMTCKEGYEPLSPLCGSWPFVRSPLFVAFLACHICRFVALCADGYFSTLGKCQQCGDPQIGAFVGVFILMVIAVVVLYYLFKKNKHNLPNTWMTHFKILVATGRVNHRMITSELLAFKPQLTFPP